MATSIQEESDDLSTCCICLEPYDNELRKPKFIPCAHTYCLQCIKGMAPDPATPFICPVCKMVCELPANIESLPTNLYVMHIIQLNKNKEEESCQKNWCETCDCVAKPCCHQSNHTLTNMMASDSSKVERLLVKVARQLNEAVANREESQQHLLANRDWLKAKLEAVEAQLEENDRYLPKLRAAIDKCEAIKLMSQSNKALATIKKKLEKMFSEAKDGLKEAKEFLSGIVAGDMLHQRKRNATDYTGENCATTTLLNPCKSSQTRGSFTANCFSVYHHQLDPSLKFYCQDLIAHNGGVITNEFSEDGTLLASGGLDKIVRLWPIGNSTGNEKDTIIPIKMKTIHESCIYCLAIISDNRRLFSGEKNGKVFIHDIPTAKRTHTIGDVKCAWSISVNAESDGNIFALACLDDTIRIFDIRCNTSQPMIQTTVQQQYGNLHSVVFSPIDPTLIAAAGTGGTQLLDIRQQDLMSCRHLFPVTDGTTVSAMFNSMGTRLLCRELENQGPQHIVIHKIPSEGQQQGSNEQMEKIKLKSAGYTASRMGLKICCFAGEDDDLVIAASSEANLHIWSVPDVRSSGNGMAEQFLLSLSGHKQAINSVDYCNVSSALASCSGDSVIKLWTPSRN